MDKVFGQGEEKIARYAEEVFKPQDDLLREITFRSLKAGLPEIQVAPMDGLHLEVLVKAMGIKKAVEVGTLGGYSGVCICRGMGPQGKLFTFEINERNAAVARESFDLAGFKNNTEIIMGPAIMNLPRINKEGPFDLVFIDADKENYPYYLKWAAENLRVGGVVIGDNTFAWGTIADEEDSSASVEALRAFNLDCAQGGRFKATVLPTGEGLTLGVKIK
jgi:caffeoyl-CoA O-methyltransferase